ncbi:MAG: hypothetical protein R3E18_12425 [Sphingomonadaceae bacterium]|nr:hypothetical protein [Sphingomonadaceae bacterium]
MKSLFALAASLLLVAATDQAASPKSVALGETAELGHGLRVTPLVVEEDSRCPEDVTCMWAGRLVLRVAVERGEEATEHLLELSVPTRSFGGMLTLTSAVPAPRTDSPALAGPGYRFSFSYAPDLAR